VAAEVVVLTFSLEELDERLERAVVKAKLQQPDKVPKLLLTPDELCDALGIGRSKLDELVRKGLPQVRLGAQTPRYKLADVETWFAMNPDPLADEGTV
jgi:excisionase family DNA binding protein